MRNPEYAGEGFTTEKSNSKSCSRSDSTVPFQRSSYWPFSALFPIFSLSHSCVQVLYSPNHRIACGLQILFVLAIQAGLSFSYGFSCTFVVFIVCRNAAYNESLLND